ncbi:hypothetical protein [Paenibacillus sp. RC84]|uniref:hypothetical protein n=1 Tax=Paenibacillus sp. RC84 TaxID=3156252 RepID=UPI003512CA24
MKDADWERLLRQSLASAAEPEEKLNESIIHQLKERSQMKHRHRKRLSAGLLAAVLILVLSVSAYAATRLYSAKQVAEHLSNQPLAHAFESKSAIQTNQSIASGDYLFTLHGLVSGAGLSEFKHSSENIYPERTYAVISITRQDGKPMRNTDDPEYAKDPFFISPLIKGQKPWEVNIVTMNGAYSEDVIDGVMYRLIECSQVEMFADRGVYLAVSSGTAFFSKEAFAYDEKTGEIQPREDYSGATALFNLPLDVAKADHAKAEAYLKELRKPSSSPDNGAEEEEGVTRMKVLRAKIRDGQTIDGIISESIKKVTYDNSGNMKYTHDDWSVATSPKEYFKEGQIGYSDNFTISGDGSSYKALLFHKDENGVITGRIVVVD